MDPLLAQCRWPDLAEPYAEALRDAVALILGRFTPQGIVAAGSIVRGTPHRSSDLDIYVVHAAPVRQRVQRLFAGVPAEIFVNPPAAIRGYFGEEQASGRPLTAHMLATGYVVLDRDPVIAELRSEAAALLAQPPVLSAAQLQRERYMAATLFEDAIDVADADAATADLLLGQAVPLLLQHLFRRSGLFVPRTKELLARTAALDADVGALARQFYGAPEHRERRALAEQIADRTIGGRGFFEWESAVEPIDGA